MRVILVGFMGSGKSTVAALLARQIGWPLLELDQLILEMSGFSNISEIFAQQGEAYFRELEAAVLAGALRQDAVIISAGGGVVGREENRQLLKEPGTTVVYLECSLAEALRRIGDSHQRPLAQSPEQLKMLYDQRLPLYKEVADLGVNTEAKSPALVAAEIQAVLFHD